ncbi:conserved phage C-terminal domain-containing protein, partial [Bacillus cytotoxicus]|uniref:conserved phage C-terminal domain-containing protein n=2 Tax=Bacillus cytotoxicus TaxID=580165 RepID=UPI00244C9ADE
DDKNKIVKWETVIYEIPKKEPVAEIPLVEKPLVEKPPVENPELLNTKEPNTKELNTDINKYIVEIVDYLNDVCSSSYRSTTKKTQSLIKVRLKEKFTVDDFKKVIDVKHAEWTGTSRAKYLRPETLFGTKFESYLQQWELWKNGKTRGYNVGSYGKSADHVPEEVGRGIKPADNRGFAKTIG